MDLLAALSRQIHATEELVRNRTMRNPNEAIEDEETRSQRLADGVARFGGSWAFIISFGVVLIVDSSINILLGQKAWESLLIHPAQPVSFHAGRYSGAGDHDESEPAGSARSAP